MKQIISVYLLNKRINSTLVVLSFASVALLLLRVKITLSFYLLFLIWNLFLAIIPYSISAFIHKAKLAPNNFKSIAVYTVWLLFLPNSFYLVTDFIHLYHENLLQLVFDTIMLSFFSMAGFYSGILSVYHIHSILRDQFSKKSTTLIIAWICILSAFGIYMGRILRFNSWDILSNPIDLFTTVLENLFQPDALWITAVLAVVIYLSYQLFLFVKDKSH